MGVPSLNDLAVDGTLNTTNQPTNTAIGERFFAADIFENKTRVSQEQGRQLTYIDTIKHVGFSPNAADLTKKLYPFSDSSMYLSKLLFLH